MRHSFFIAGVLMLLAPATGNAQTSPEIAFSSVPAVAAHIRRAHDVILSAWVLSPRGSVGQAMIGAADRGARVHLVLEGRSGSVRSSNAEAAAVFARHRIRVDLTERPLHAKAAVIDGVVYLSDRNWASRARSELVLIDRIERDKPIVLRAIAGTSGGNEHFSTRKRDALALETQVVESGTESTVYVETEAFTPGTAVEAVLLRRARNGSHVQLIVDRREYGKSPRERSALARLVRQGIDVRAGHTSEKLAVAGSKVWVGSANMTPGVPEQIDWGMRLPPEYADRIVANFLRNWQNAEPVSLYR